MATTAETQAPPRETVEHDPHASSHDAHDDHHIPDLGHHWDDLNQQFDAAKLGMWLFLVTEILFFSGLFVAYAIFRSFKPEIFAWGHAQLEVLPGLINTIVLIFSSVTMAWAVRAAQLGQQGLTIAMLIVTIACGFTFCGVKSYEYSSKLMHGHGPGKHFGTHYLTFLTGEDHNGEHGHEGHGHEEGAGQKHSGEEHSGQEHSGQEHAEEKHSGKEHSHAEDSDHQPNGSGQEDEQLESQSASMANSVDSHEGHGQGPPPRNAHIYFSIYFSMTGLHAFHVIVGIGVLLWILVRTINGDFSPSYYTPVELTGLYWHLVDLIWIFLFPMLYLVD